MKSLAISLFVSFSLALALPAQADRCPNLAILLDRSGSMNLTPAGGNPQPGEMTRWQIAQAALTSIINEYDGKLPIGLALFATDNSCATGSFQVAPDYSTKQQFLAALNNASNAPGGNTPTCDAINKLRNASALKDPIRKQYILLVTDGQPNCSSCGAANPVNGTVNEIDAAFKQSPSIHTFVIGFGNLPDPLPANLNEMARKGGEPNPDPNYDFYPANDQASLLTALRSIINSIAGGDAGGGAQCDDSCYSIPCPNAGDLCIAATCKQNPCAGASCTGGEYCYTDGTTQQCIGVCNLSCPAGNRCVRGQCQPDSCAVACGPNMACEAASGQCKPDPACNGISCKPTQGCFGGQCKDDPCRLISCPADTTCISFEGTCVPNDYLTDVCKYVNCPNKTVCDPTQRACIADAVSPGCSCDLSDAQSRGGALVAPACLLLAFVALRRSRRARQS